MVIKKIEIKIKKYIYTYNGRGKSAGESRGVHVGVGGVANEWRGRESR